MIPSASRIASRPLLLGHRGFRDRGLRRLAAGSRLENSPAAFKVALSCGCDGFEFDVRHTRDGRNVLWHDPDWNGMEIAATDYADLADREGSSLTSLEDVLEQFSQRAFLDIELKVPGSEEAIIAAIKGNPPHRGVIVSSFLPDVVTRLNRLDGRLPLGFSCAYEEMIGLWRKLPIEVFLPRHDFVQPQLIADVHRHGCQIMSWTVNSPRRMQDLATWGIDGLISDDPALLYQTFHIA